MEQFCLDKEKLQDLKTALEPECKRLKEVSRTLNPAEEQKRLAEQKLELESGMNELTTSSEGYESELKSVEEQIEALKKRRANLMVMIKKNNKEQEKVKEKLDECEKMKSTKLSVKIAQREFAKASLKGIHCNFEDAETILGNLSERIYCNFEDAETSL